MQRLMLGLLLAGVSGGAVAAWVEVAGNDKHTIYVDPTTIRKTGHIVKMWYLMDFKTPETRGGTEPYLSSKDQSEYDCKEERSRTLYYTNHSGNMGNGDTTYISVAPLNWSPIPPGSLREAVWEFACGKK